MTIEGAPAVEACVGAGGGEGTYTIRVGACRFGQPPMNNARLHHKNGKALSFTSLEILSFSTIAGETRSVRGALPSLFPHVTSRAGQFRRQA
jgi:hypothetical protein